MDFEDGELFAVAEDEERGCGVGGAEYAVGCDVEDFTIAQVFLVVASKGIEGEVTVEKGGAGVDTAGGAGFNNVVEFELDVGERAVTGIGVGESESEDAGGGCGG